AEDGIRDGHVTGVQTCALPIYKWVWGWDGVLLSDYYFFSDYRLSQYKDPLNSFLSLPTEAISQLYLTGVGNRSYFDARTIYYLRSEERRVGRECASWFARESSR